MAEFRKLTSRDIVESVYSFNYLYNNKFHITNKEDILQLCNISTNQQDAERLVKLFLVLPDSLSFEERLSSLKLNYNFFKNTNISEILNKDKIFQNISPSLYKSHVESIYQYNVIGKDGTHFASFDFYFNINKHSKLELIINNLQGENIKRLKEVPKELKNVNWRLMITKNIVDLGKKMGATVIGNFPKHYSQDGVNDKEYLRQLETYLLTYLKADIKPENISLRNIENAEYKFEFKKTLNLLKSKPEQEIRKITRAFESQRYRDQVPKEQAKKSNQLEIKFPKRIIKNKIK